MTRRRKPVLKIKLTPQTKRLLTLFLSVILITSLFFFVTNFPPQGFFSIFVFFLLLILTLLVLFQTIFFTLAFRYTLLITSYLWFLFFLRYLHQLHSLNLILLTALFSGLYFLAKPYTAKKR